MSCVLVLLTAFLVGLFSFQTTVWIRTWALWPDNLSNLVDEPRASTPVGTEISIRYLGRGPCLDSGRKWFEIINNGSDTVHFDPIPGKKVYWYLENGSVLSVPGPFYEGTKLKLSPGDKVQLSLKLEGDPSRLEFSFYYLIDNKRVFRYSSVISASPDRDAVCG
jgi:hypothetical protein